ncbi:hypothetical protein [Geomicrobium sp. JCM 19039]|uniref:hypothetical protein n=1 Tax=Geomicrobium sp. JCM 19039 TaxID=1460636 RepID=UPI00045F3292|nr:hypothetical protein [Geomicrobium sp. JCM 19039]GAK11724.1 hypothetical protein JCM19039_1439 [Geomicrobium sp. JCM 19039]
MKNILVHTLLLIVFTLMLVGDSFPEMPIIGGVSIVIWFIAIIIIYFIIFKVKAIDTSDPLYRFKTQLVLTVYVVGLIFFLDVIGGQSQIGISPENEIFWLIVFVSVIDLVFQWRRVKRLNEQTEK